MSLYGNGYLDQKDEAFCFCSRQTAERFHSSRLRTGTLPPMKISISSSRRSIKCFESSSFSNIHNLPFLLLALFPSSFLLCLFQYPSFFAISLIKKHEDFRVAPMLRSQLSCWPVFRHHTSDQKRRLFPRRSGLSYTKDWSFDTSKGFKPQRLCSETAKGSGE